MTLSANQVLGLIDGLAPVGAESEMEGRNYITYSKEITDGGTAGTDALVSPIMNFPTSQFPNGVRVVSMAFMPSVAVTGADATAKTITVTRVTSAGASSTSVGAIVTNLAGGNIAANEAKAITVTAANAVVPAGGSLLATMTHAGAGMAIASATGPARLFVTVQAL